MAKNKMRQLAERLNDWTIPYLLTRLKIRTQEEKSLKRKDVTMIITPQCFKRNCKHFLGVKNDGDETTERVYCAAFPDRIPNKIAYGDNLHLTPVEGDHGIQFEKES